MEDGGSASAREPGDGRVCWLVRIEGAQASMWEPKGGCRPRPHAGGWATSSTWGTRTCGGDSGAVDTAGAPCGAVQQAEGMGNES